MYLKFVTPLPKFVGTPKPSFSTEWGVVPSSELGVVEGSGFRVQGSVIRVYGC